MLKTSLALGHFCRRLMPRSSATVRGMCEFERADYAMSKMRSMFDLDQDSIIVSSYSNLGFKVSPGIQVIGPVVLFPHTVLHWNVKSAQHIDKHSLVLFSLLEPKLDMLVIGKGMEIDQLKPDVHLFLRSKGINVEVLPTEQACGLFNM
ncbi:NADH dehydrogenase [ubiquinone] 1 alpha subcomplex assembly factor 3-like isoform X2 [Mizuhopecten yessoensis]|nr:NADH dehydrogenase [ubiquinone] 1 alpha subcomplex assembly factor 3-like isoform X2 [Mizuhopecten yessoensis]